MKKAIITVAGISSRFNQGMERAVLKSIYSSSGRIKETMLANILQRCSDCQQIVIVGGFMYEELEDFVKKNWQGNSSIRMVFNPYYATYGSGYSLQMGIKALDHGNLDEIILIEGDLYFDEVSFKRVLDSKRNVLTICREPIYSSKSVVLYLDAENHPHYLYDTDHGILQIRVPFSAVFNSGQIWKFINGRKLMQVVEDLSQKQSKGTNLEIIQGYFENMEQTEYEISTMDTWVNCNTIEDYEKIMNLMKGDAK